MPNTKYLGDATKSNWVSSGQPVAFENSVLLTMAQGTVGTLLASTSYMWYGKVAATLKTSRTAGVVTAFILLSDVKDEIDFEFVGTDLGTAQSNYYFQGITNYNNEVNISVSDTFGTYHTYEIDWTPESITWSVDGVAHRTKKRSDTWNATSNQFHFPQTPARIQLSLWPAGLSSNGKGTVDWAGGLVDWNSPDIKNAGYFYAMVNEVNVQCYDPPAGAKISGKTSYIYDSTAGTNNTVETTDKPTVLKSQLGTGTNMDAGAPSGTASASAGVSTSEIPTVPGLTGGGTGSNGLRGGDSGSSGSSGSSESSAAPVATPESTGFHGFSQNPGSSTSSTLRSERLLQGSLLAALVAIVGMLMM
ncbi:hypothetical protein MMC30_006081 [Trapelia coarctata]|nr:hypothetical protein [Trapelia coarctata]